MQDSNPSFSIEPSQHFERYKIHISPKKILQFIMVVIVILSFISFVIKLPDNLQINYPYRSSLVKAFYVDSEKNVPSLFSVTLLFFDSFVLAIIAHLKRIAKHANLGHWLGLSTIFFFLAMDECFSFHELLVSPLHDALHVHGGLLTFSWVVGGGIFVLLFLLSYTRFTFKLPAKTRRLFITAFALYVGGAIGLEMIGGNLADLYGFESLPYLIETTVEESIEMLGAAVFLYALLSYLKSQLPDREIHLCLHKK
jgi:hypothetical protein